MIDDDTAVEPVSSERRDPGGVPPVTFRWWEALLAYLFGNLVLGALVVSILGGADGELTPTRLVVASFAIDLLFLGSLLVWLRNAHPGSWAAIGVSWRGRTIAAAAAGELVLYGVTALAIGLSLQWLLERAVGHPVPDPEQMPEGLAAPATLLFVVLAVVVAPVVEEVFFRGILYRSVRDRYGLAAGLVGSSLVFGLVHTLDAPITTVVLLQTVMVLTGLGFAVIYERAGTLLASIAAHAAFNTVGVIVILGARA